MPWLFFINRNNIGFFTVACAQLSILHDELNNSRNYTLLSSSDGIEEEKYERIYIHNLTLPFWFSYCSTCLILKEEVEKPLLPALPYLRPYIHPATFNDNKRRRFVLVAFFLSCSIFHHIVYEHAFIFEEVEVEKNLSKKNKKSNSLNFRSGINSKKKNL